MRMVKEQGFDKIFDGQTIFRLLTDSMARPGKLNNIGDVCEKIDAPISFSQALAGIVFTLVDGETPISLLVADLKEVEEFIKWNTMGQTAEIEKADYLFVQKSVSDEEIGYLMAAVKKGTLEEPHLSATLFISAEKVSTELMSEKGLELQLKGPGIKGRNSVFMSGVSERWIEERDKANVEYPLGVDMVFVSENGDILCLPRTTRIERR